jgi:hypothetical protein
MDTRHIRVEPVDPLLYAAKESDNYNRGMFMRYPTLVTRLLTVSLLLLVAPAAFAQRTFVSAKTGNDANPCTPTSPCRTFAVALAAVAAGGEIIVLDSGGYGGVTITKAISITAPLGIYAGISVPSGTGITINAGGSDNVTLRGLTLNGASSGTGIQFNTGATLTVVDCSVTGFFSGLVFSPSAATSSCIVEHSVFLNNASIGINQNITGNLIVRNSVVSGSSAGGTGINVHANSASGATASIVDCLLSGNYLGLNVDFEGGSAPSHVRMSGTHITNGFQGLLNNSEVVSIGNNMIRGNNFETGGTAITVVAGN